MEGLLVFLLSLLLIIQRQCETCTLHKKPCLHACVKKCDHGDCLGADCSGYAGHFLRCPQGTFSIFFSSNSSRFHCLMLTCIFFSLLCFFVEIIYLSIQGNPCEGCFGNPCENDGICKDISKDPSRDERFQCQCLKPFKGKKCERWGKT